MDLIETLASILLVIIAFGFIIFIHELGHFIAARWAGVRVLAFALGFGPAIVSYRKGMGLQRGSSEVKYLELVKARREGLDHSTTEISSTEYRLNAILFGGYVKMLGQVDGDPTQVSDEPDGYQRCPVWKRMIIMSAGVVMNVLLACVLFVIVFTVGMKTEPATIGMVSPTSPASRAIEISSPSSNVRPGLLPGDRIVSIGGQSPKHFNDVTMAVAMTPKLSPVRLTVDRPDVGRLTFEAMPEVSPQSKLLEIGIAPPFSDHIVEVKSKQDRAAFEAYVRELGVAQLEPGMRLVRAGAITKIDGAHSLDDAANASQGKPFEAEFEGKDGKHVTITLTPRALLQTSYVSLEPGSAMALDHLLGLTPVLSVAPAVEAGGDRQGLQDNDIFARVGAVEYPSIASGIAEIHRNKGKTIAVNVLRAKPDGTLAIVPLDPSPMVKNEGKGQIGFGANDSRSFGTWVALPPKLLLSRATAAADTGKPPSAAGVISVAGSRILAVNGKSVTNFTTLREALKDATAEALHANSDAKVSLTIEYPGHSGASESAQTGTIEWPISSDDVKALHALRWISPLSPVIFEPEVFLDRAADPGAAITRGLGEVKRVMVMTYLTFARLLDGTVKVEHLKGPVGITAIGTKVVSKGAIWLMFYMALISVNLAVLNFLPLPITDGGQFIFLAIEMIRGRPAPIAIQNIATFAGLLVIGTMFIIVTFHDVLSLF